LKLTVLQSTFKRWEGATMEPKVTPDRDGSGMTVEESAGHL
jgi:hypothetical protein